MARVSLRPAPAGPHDIRRHRRSFRLSLILVGHTPRVGSAAHYKSWVMMDIDFGKVEKYFTDRGFGFVSHTFASTSSRDIFFHIKMIKQVSPEMAQVLDDDGADGAIYFWYKFEGTAKGEQVIKVLDVSDISKREKRQIENQINNVYTNITNSLSDNIEAAAENLLSEGDISRLVKTRRNLEIKQREIEEQRQREREALQEERRLAAEAERKRYIERERATRSRRIQMFVEARKITELFHFTRVENIPGILSHGLLGRQVILDRKMEHIFNDQYRRDKTLSAVCASISFPNYRMFYKLRKTYSDADWAVLKLDPSILWEIPCAFCASNAASDRVSYKNLEDRQSISALQLMFEDILPDTERTSLRIPCSYTTDPQAEVLILGTVDPRYIISINVNAKEEIKNIGRMRELFDPYLNKFGFYHTGSLFTYRVDFKHWQHSPQCPSDDPDIDFGFNFWS